VPTSDAAVLERLPDAGNAAAREARQLHTTLAAAPNDLELALKVARLDISEAGALADPRYLGRAEAALAPWPDAAATPAQVLLLRAMVLQSNHEFAVSLADLQRVLAVRPGDGQAWLVRAAVHQAQADYNETKADCGQLAGLTLGLAPDTCTASVMALTGHAALALRAMTISLAQSHAELAASPAIAIWSLTLAAEIAGRLDDPSAEARFGQALAAGPDDPYLLAAWSDWLLDHNRPQEVVALLSGRTRIDPLLLRLAIAEQQTGSPAAAGHIADLAARFEASRLRGDTVHRREEAMFQLDLLHRPEAALTLAAANWGVQREPADARILLRAALAARKPDSARPALDWMRANKVEDVRLASLAAHLAGS